MSNEPAKIATVLSAFIDESYCSDWFYMVAAIANSTEQIAEFEASLRDVVNDACADLWMPPVPEIHGYELLQAAGPWVGVGLQARLRVAGRVLAVVRDSGLNFIVRGMDLQAQARRYPQPYDPYPLVLTHLFRELDKHAKNRGEVIRLTCDEIHHHSRHRAMLERHRKHGTPGYSVSNLNQVAEKLQFVDSRSSGMIQAADVVAYLKHRIVSKPNAPRPERRSRDRLWRMIEPQILQDYCWVP